MVELETPPGSTLQPPCLSFSLKVAALAEEPDDRDIRTKFELRDKWANMVEPLRRMIVLWTGIAEVCSY